MKSNINYNDWLSKIAESKYFTSANDVKLLQYLINSTLEEKTLKETIIAIDVFGRDASFDPSSDSIVRSNIYNLRKKLESYYRNEGASDKIRFVIPKGSYQVQFQENKKDSLKIDKQKGIALKIFFPLTIALTLIFAFLYFSEKHDSSAMANMNGNPVLNYYIHSGNSLLIVLGDYFMMEKTQLPDSSFNYVRDPEINNQNDLLKYLEKKPELKESLKKLGQSYFGEEIPLCFHQLLKILGKQSQNVRMKYASELLLSDIRENDIIFVGDFATLGILKPFFKKTNFRYSNLPPAIYILNDKQDTTEFISLNNPDRSVFQNDYAVVSNISGYEGKKMLFFLSFLPFGKSEALYKLNEESFIDELTKMISPLPDDWNLLLKVSGLQSTGFYYEIMRFDPVNEH